VELGDTAVGAHQLLQVGHVVLEQPLASDDGDRAVGGAASLVLLALGAVAGLAVLGAHLAVPDLGRVARALGRDVQKALAVGVGARPSCHLRETHPLHSATGIGWHPRAGGGWPGLPGQGEVCQCARTQQRGRGRRSSPGQAGQDPSLASSWTTRRSCCPSRDILTYVMMHINFVVIFTIGILS
jgi:hypothetical protein